MEEEEEEEEGPGKMRLCVQNVLLAGHPGYKNNVVFVVPNCQAKYRITGNFCWYIFSYNFDFFR